MTLSNILWTPIVIAAIALFAFDSSWNSVIAGTTCGTDLVVIEGWLTIPAEYVDWYGENMLKTEGTEEYCK
tara:strand:- start:346 stop:558 length:213 start_codon:yes stop_codon:yes gene_type:complete